MKRIAALASVVVAGLSLTGTSFGRQGSKRATTPVHAANQPDQVIQWNQELLTLLQVPGAQPATIHPTRTMAITQLAVYDAVNAVVGGHRGYLFRGSAPRNASSDAAAAAAARTALSALLPTQTQAIDAKYQQSLAQLGSNNSVQAGIRVGEQAARTILAARANDGSAVTPPPFTPLLAPGEYQLTPPKFVQPVFTQWPHVKPFALRSGDQFRPQAPPAVSSARYADDFTEVKALGEVNSTARSDEQTAIGRFWSLAPVQNVWNQITQMAGVSFHNTLAQNARLFALVDTSLADSVIGLYDAKYAYHRARPVTAIEAALTGNPAAISNFAWTPLTPTATDPSYPGAHADISEAAAVTLRDFFGTDRFDFALSNPNLPSVVRGFGSFSAAADEASASRIFAGQHFRFDEEAGQALGGQVADFVADNLLLVQPPAPKNHRHGGRSR